MQQNLKFKSQMTHHTKVLTMTWVAILFAVTFESVTADTDWIPIAGPFPVRDPSRQDTSGLRRRLPGTSSAFRQPLYQRGVGRLLLATPKKGPFHRQPFPTKHRSSSFSAMPAYGTVAFNPTSLDDGDYGFNDHFLMLNKPNHRGQHMHGAQFPNPLVRDIQNHRFLNQHRYTSYQNHQEFQQVDPRHHHHHHQQQEEPRPNRIFKTGHDLHRESGNQESGQDQRQYPSNRSQERNNRLHPEEQNPNNAKNHYEEQRNNDRKTKGHDDRQHVKRPQPQQHPSTSSHKIAITIQVPQRNNLKLSVTQQSPHGNQYSNRFIITKESGASQQPQRQMEIQPPSDNNPFDKPNLSFGVQEQGNGPKHSIQPSNIQYQPNRNEIINNEPNRPYNQRPAQPQGPLPNVLNLPARTQQGPAHQHPPHQPLKFNMQYPLPQQIPPRSNSHLQTQQPQSQIVQNYNQGVRNEQHPANLGPQHTLRNGDRQHPQEPKQSHPDNQQYSVPIQTTPPRPFPVQNTNPQQYIGPIKLEPQRPNLSQQNHFQPSATLMLKQPLQPQQSPQSQQRPIESQQPMKPQPPIEYRQPLKPQILIEPQLPMKPQRPNELILPQTQHSQRPIQQNVQPQQPNDHWGPLLSPQPHNIQRPIIQSQQTFQPQQTLVAQIPNGPQQSPQFKQPSEPQRSLQTQQTFMPQRPHGPPQSQDAQRQPEPQQRNGPQQILLIDRPLDHQRPHQHQQQPPLEPQRQIQTQVPLVPQQAVHPSRHQGPQQILPSHPPIEHKLPLRPRQNLQPQQTFQQPQKQPPGPPGNLNFSPETKFTLAPSEHHTHVLQPHNQGTQNKQPTPPNVGHFPNEHHPKFPDNRHGNQNRFPDALPTNHNQLGPIHGQQEQRHPGPSNFQQPQPFREQVTPNGHPAQDHRIQVSTMPSVTFKSPMHEVSISDQHQRTRVTILVQGPRPVKLGKVYERPKPKLPALNSFLPQTESQRPLPAKNMNFQQSPMNIVDNSIIDVVKRTIYYGDMDFKVTSPYFIFSIPDNIK